MADATPANLPSVGFVLLSFNLPEQTINLCRRLTDLFGAPPIALHHDFGQCNLNRRKLPSNVCLVEPWLATGWGIFPVVEANFAALRLLYERADPDWCVSLSTADYPIKSAERILSDLQQAPCDAFLDHRELHVPHLPPDYVRQQSRGFADLAWLEVAYNRYVAIDANPSRLTWHFPVLDRPRLLRGALAEQLLTPFGREFRPFGGDAWYTLNRKAARILPQEGKQLDRLRKHYRNRRVPEESIYQTILCNRSDLRICPDSRRYADWSLGGSGPRFLNGTDVPTLLHSSAHFARKFRFDPDLFHLLDCAAADPSPAFQPTLPPEVPTEALLGPYPDPLAPCYPQPQTWRHPFVPPAARSSTLPRPAPLPASMAKLPHSPTPTSPNSTATPS